MTNTYKRLPVARFEQGEFALVPIRPIDIEPIRRWRNEQIRVLRQNQPISEEQQRAYFEQQIWPSFSLDRPAQILLSFLRNDELIGYGGLVHINWPDQRAEVSFLVNTVLTQDLAGYLALFRTYLSLLQRVAFDALGLNRLVTETYDIRPEHIAVTEECGFLLEGRMREHVCIDGQFVDSLIHGRLRRDYLQAIESAVPMAHGRSVEAADGKNVGNVLVTSISGKVPLLRAVKRALQKTGAAAQVIGCDLNPACLGRYFVDDFWAMPPLNELSSDALLAALRDRKIRTVIPTRDGELVFWSQHKSRLAQQGISVMVSDETGVRSCLDKLAFYELAVQKHLPVVLTTDNLDTLPLGPVVVKERYGSGSTNIRINVPHDEAREALKSFTEPIVQPFIAGQEFSVDAYIDLSGRVKGVVGRTRDLVVHGESQVTSTVQDADLEQVSTEILYALALYGHVVLQLIKDPAGRWHLIECNSRFGGASTLSIAAGLDSFYWFLLESQKEELAAVPFVRSSTPLRQVRYPADIVTTW